MSPSADAVDRMLALYHAGDEAASEALARAIAAAQPGNAAALSMCGVFEARRGAYTPAADWFGRAAEADPAAPGPRLNLAQAFDALGRYDEAVQRFGEAIERGASAPHVFAGLGSALERSGRLLEALAAFDRALEIDADHLPALYERADALIALGREHEAAATLDRALAAGAEPDRIAYARAALGLAPPVAASPPGYVRSLFDGYAERFDTHLVGHLRYQVPERLADLLERHGIGGGLAVLDAGCGTGLCGPLVAHHAERLEGVDLSPRMLAQAERRGCYQRLDCAELIAHLDAHPARWDLVIAADVVIYFGELGPLLAAVRRALRPGGHFAFSVEHSEDAPVVLNRTRRFAHSRAHVAQAAAGFRLVADEPITARREGGADVPARLVLLASEPASPTGS